MRFELWVQIYKNLTFSKYKNLTLTLELIII